MPDINFKHYVINWWSIASDNKNVLALFHSNKKIAVFYNDMIHIKHSHMCVWTTFKPCSLDVTVISGTRTTFSVWKSEAFIGIICTRFFIEIYFKAKIHIYSYTYIEQSRLEQRKNDCIRPLILLLIYLRLVNPDYQYCTVIIWQLPEAKYMVFAL